jgi:hypothetical protein
MKLIIALLAVGLLSGGCVSQQAAFERGRLATYGETSIKATADRMDERYRLAVQQLAAERQAVIDERNRIAIATMEAEAAADPTSVTWQDGWDLRGRYERKTEGNRQALVAAITDSTEDRAVLYTLAPLPVIISGMADEEQAAAQRAARALVGDAYRTALGVWNSYIETKRDPVPEGSTADEDPVSNGDAYTQEDLDRFNEFGYPGR